MVGLGPSSLEAVLASTEDRRDTGGNGWGGGAGRSTGGGGGRRGGGGGQLAEAAAEAWRERCLRREQHGDREVVEAWRGKLVVSKQSASSNYLAW